RKRAEKRAAPPAPARERAGVFDVQRPAAGTVRIRSEPHAQSELEAPAWIRPASRIAEIRVDFRRRRNEVVEAAEVAVVRRVEDLADDADVHETPDQEILLQPEIPRLIRRVEREAAFLLPFVQPSTVFVRTETLAVVVGRVREPRARRGGGT